MTDLKAWLAHEPAIVWGLFTNGVAAGTIWAVLPQFGIHVPTDMQPMIVGAVNLLNAVIVRSQVTANAHVPPPGSGAV